MGRGRSGRWRIGGGVMLNLLFQAIAMVHKVLPFLVMEFLQF